MLSFLLTVFVFALPVWFVSSMDRKGFDVMGPLAGSVVGGTLYFGLLFLAVAGSVDVSPVSDWASVYSTHAPMQKFWIMIFSVPLALVQAAASWAGAAALSRNAKEQPASRGVLAACGSGFLVTLVYGCMVLLLI